MLLYDLLCCRGAGQADPRLGIQEKCILGLIWAVCFIFGLLSPQLLGRAAAAGQGGAIILATVPKQANIKLQHCDTRLVLLST